MSCNHCGVKFNFFHKETGCSNCGLSFCNKCLKQRCKVPNKGSNDVVVCKTCYTGLTISNENQITKNIPPPDAYLKRLEALENPAAPPITVYQNDSKLQSLRKGLSVADQQLLDRLERLKDDKEKRAPPTEDELRRRLNNLKDQNEYVEGPSRVTLPPVDNRSDQEKVDSLLEQFKNETDIELQHNPEEGIEARLASLREQGVRPNEGPYISNLHDSGSEEEVDKITKKIMDEVALEEKCSSDLPAKQNSEEKEEDGSSPELPWCVLCNKDACFRCLDCDDLYCAECNIEAHKTWGDSDHNVIKYKKK